MLFKFICKWILMYLFVQFVIFKYIIFQIHFIIIYINMIKLESKKIKTLKFCEIMKIIPDLNKM